MIKIEIETILINLLLKQKEVSISDVNNIKKILNKKLKETVYIDCSMDSFCWSVELRPNIFTFKSNNICRAIKSNKFYKEKYIKENYNCLLTKEIIKIIRR